MRFGETVLDQVGSGHLDPRRVDGRVGSCPESGGLDQFGRHHPVGGFAEQRRTGLHDEPHPASPEEVASFLVALPDVRQQAGEHRLVHGVLAGRALRPSPPLLLTCFTQLGVQVLPLTHPQVVQVLPAAHPPESTAGQRFLLLAQVVPQVDQREEVAGLVLEAGVRLVRLRLLLRRSFARILDRERRHDDEHFGERSVLVRGEQHPRQAGIGG